ncbi:MAG: hypothetical protein MUE79_05485 [Nitratireductor sp.]|nr:hypothetical protein [Nitratireductor sp.]
MAAVPDLSAYVLPDGSYPDLCLSDHGTGGIESERGCDFCRLAAGALLPAPAAMHWTAPRPGDPLALKSDAMPPPQSVLGSRSQRGPPVFS